MTKRIVRIDHLKAPMPYYVGKKTTLVANKQEACIFDDKKDIDLIIDLWRACGLMIVVEEVDSE